MSSATRLKLTEFWTAVQENGLFILCIGLIIRECVVVSAHLAQFSTSLGFLAGTLFLGINGYIFGLLHKRLNRFQKTLAFLISGAAAFSVLGNAGAANAQFLQNAEDFFTAGADTFGLGEQVTLLVTLIFWIIRGAFVIGVAIALLPAIQAAREGDEWRSLAKTPMLVVGIVLAGATSVDFLVGGAGG